MEENTTMNPAVTEAPSAENAATAPETPLPQDTDGASKETGGEESQDESGGWESILPKDWTEDEDLLAGPKLETLFNAKADGAAETEGAETEGKSNAPEQSAPERKTPADQADPSDSGEPDYKAMYQVLAQEKKDAADRETFQKVYQEELAAGMSERWARTAAANAVGGRTFPLDGEQENGGQADSSAAAAAAVKQLSTLYPDVKEIPPEVGRMVKDGVDLVSAYSAYRTREADRTIQNLRAENQRLQRMVRNTVKAPPQGVSGGASHREDMDEFLRGMNADFQ